MRMNSIGQCFRFTSFGESHGVAIGGVIDGCPAGMLLDMELISLELQRRRPGQSSLTTQRKETDEVEFLSGIFEGKTTGAPIAFIIRNQNQHSADYEHLRNVFRPSHADYTYEMKYGVRDYRGGGRSSARETASRVVAGAIAKQFLRTKGIEIIAYTSQVGEIALEQDYVLTDAGQIEQNPVRCPDENKARQMVELIEKVRDEGDSIGGTITCVMRGLPVGLGEPVFGKLQAMLAYAMLSINAVKGFEYGSGFRFLHAKGSELNDSFCTEQGRITTKTNFSGGIQGGISNGREIYCRLAIKPTATIFKEQQTVDKTGHEVLLKAYGRHDPCILPRAVPVVEAMAAITLMDAYLLNRNMD